MEQWKKWEQALTEAVDTDYSYGLAKRMEEPEPIRCLDTGRPAHRQSL